MILIYFTLVVLAVLIYTTFQTRRPQTLVYYLIFQALVIVVELGFVKRLWHAYILFIVFLGGIIVALTYVIRLRAYIQINGLSKEGRVLRFCFFLSVFIGIIGRIGERGLSIRKSYLEEVFYRVKVLSSYWRVRLYLYVVGYLLVCLYRVCRRLKLMEGPLRQIKWLSS